MTKKFEEGLDWDAKGMASITGIAFGWVQDHTMLGEGNDQQTVRCGCNHCQIVVERLWRNGLQETDIESEVLTEFRQLAEEKGCRHFGKYVQVMNEPAYQQCAGIMGFAQLLEAEGDLNRILVGKRGDEDGGASGN